MKLRRRVTHTVHLSVALIFAVGCATTEESNRDTQEYPELTAAPLPALKDLNRPEEELRAMATAEADQDGKLGNLRLLASGLPGDTWIFHVYTLKSRFDVDVIWTGCQVLGPFTMLWEEAYNERMKTYITRRYGPRAFDEVDLYAALEYQKYLDETGDDAGKQRSYQLNLRKRLKVNNW